MRLCAAGFTSSQLNPRYCESAVCRSIMTRDRNDDRQGLATDAQGRFDLRVPLLPGGLTLSVVPPPSIKPPDPEPREEPESARVLAWVRTWYPGVAVPEAASKIVLPPGGELASIELKLLALPAHAVR